MEVILYRLPAVGDGEIAKVSEHSGIYFCGRNLIATSLK